MGSPSQQQQQVYYDTDKSQYYTNGSLSGNNLLVQMLGGQLGIPERNYLGNPYGSNSFADRFTTNAQATPYAELTNLFPSLNASLMQNSPTSLLSPTDTQSSGASRFLSSNTQSK
jgi:hypothetical protein